VEDEEFLDAVEEFTEEEWDPSAENTPTLQECEEEEEEPEEELETEEILIAYCRGDGVIAAYEASDFNCPLTNEHIPPEISFRHPSGRITKIPNSAWFMFSPSHPIQKAANLAQQLAQEAQTERPKTFEELVPETFHKYKDIFDKAAMDGLPPVRHYDHKITMKPDFTPWNCKLYPLSPIEEKAMNEFIDEHLAKGTIVPSKSPQASPFFFVRKKDGSLRPCQDYRYMNEWTVKNAYPLPRITDLLDKLKGAKVFTKMDIRWGYNNVRIHAPDRWKAAFKTARGLFEPTVMFFGLCNAPATFQAMMNDIFADLIDEGWLVIYVDDLLIFSEDLETHHARTARVLQRLHDHQLSLKPEKCVFDVPEVEYLGLVIKPGQICMDQ
jgi:hypothetical protein